MEYKSKSERILEKVQEHIGGDLKISASGVPHLVIGDYYSVCYFGKYKSLRIFTGYRTPQNRPLIDFKQWNHVVDWFKNNTAFINTKPTF